MQILRSGSIIVEGGNNSPSTTTPFQLPSPVPQGYLLLHNLGTLTPTVKAYDLSNVQVYNISVTPVTDNPDYDAENLSSLNIAGGSTFTGLIILSK